MLSWLFSDPLPVGTPAPDWTLKDQDGNTVSLRSLRGKNVVLVFYPRDETPTCRAQLCEFRDAWSDVKSRNAVVFGINPQSASSHAAFKDNQKLPFPLLEDKGGSVCEAYNTRGIMTKRTVYVIDENGIIRYARRGKPEVAEVLAATAGGANKGT